MLCNCVSVKPTSRKKLLNIVSKLNFTDGKAPLARHISLSSYTGYHTPIEDEVATSAIIEGEGGLAVSKKESLMVPSPSSAIMTVSLEGYLEPQRFSFSSPPDTENNRPSSPDETYPVFSPPPSATDVSISIFLIRSTLLLSYH